MSATTDRTNKPGRTLDPFVWYPKEIENFPHTRTLDTIKSLAGGVAVVLKLIEADDLNDGDHSCYGRVLTPSQVGDLMRLVIAASHTIETECELAMEWAEKHGATCIKDLAAKMEHQG